MGVITQSHRASEVRGLCSGNLVQPCGACSTVSTGCRWEASGKLVRFTEGQWECTVFCSLGFRELYSHQYSPFYSILKFSCRIVNPWTLVPEKYLSMWWVCPCFHCSLMKIMKSLLVCGRYVLSITWNLNERDSSRSFDFPGCRNRWVAAWITLPQDLWDSVELLHLGLIWCSDMQVSILIVFHSAMCPGLGKPHPRKRVFWSIVIVHTRVPSHKHIHVHAGYPYT